MCPFALSSCKRALRQKHWRQVAWHALGRRYCALSPCYAPNDLSCQKAIALGRATMRSARPFLSRVSPHPASPWPRTQSHACATVCVTGPLHLQSSTIWKCASAKTTTSTPTVVCSPALGISDAEAPLVWFCDHSWRTCYWRARDSE